MFGYEFSIEEAHWDALLGEYSEQDIASGKVSFELSNERLVITGTLVELLDRPRVLIRVKEECPIC